jgi:hypothetical protein
MELYDKNDMNLMNHGIKYMELAKEHSKAQHDYAEAEGVLEVFGARLATELSELSGKKFIGAESFIRILLEWGGKNPDNDLASKIKARHQQLRTSKGKIEGLKGEMKAMQAQIDLLRSKMSYEKAQTTN